MKIINFQFLVLFLFFSFASFGQKIQLSEEEKEWIKEHPVVYFGYDPYWPPYEMYVNGKYTGVCADFIKAISKRCGVNFVPLKNTTWEKSLRMLKNNQLMMVPGAAITEERKK